MLSLDDLTMKGLRRKEEGWVGVGGGVGGLGRAAPQQGYDLSWAFVSSGESLGVVAWVERTSQIKYGN